MGKRSKDEKKVHKIFTLRMGKRSQDWKNAPAPRDSNCFSRTYVRIILEKRIASNQGEAYKKFIGRMGKRSKDEKKVHKKFTLRMGKRSQY